MKRLLGVLVVLSLLVVMGVSLATAKVTIRVISSDDFAPFRKSVIPAFEKLYPNIKVDFSSVGYDNLLQKELTALSADRSAYDVIDVDCIWVSEYVNMGILEPLDRYISSSEKSKIIKSLRDTFTYKGHLYVMPMFHDALFFYYNVDMLKKAGLSRPPKTWDEFVKYSKIVQEKKVAPYGSIWGWSQNEGLICYYGALLYGFGGKFFDKNGEPAFNKGGGLKALQWMVDSIYKWKVVDPNSITATDRDILHSLASGRVPFGFEWSFAWGVFEDPKQSKVKGKIRVGLVPSNVKGLPSATATGPMGLSITSGSKHKAAAWKFINFLASKKNQVKQSVEYGAMPIWKSLYKSPEVLKHHPEFGVMVEQLKYAFNRPQVPYYTEFSHILQVALQKALTKKMSPKDALDEAAKKIAELKK